VKVFLSITFCYEERTFCLLVWFRWWYLEDGGGGYSVPLRCCSHSSAYIGRGWDTFTAILFSAIHYYYWRNSAVIYCIVHSVDAWFCYVYCLMPWTWNLGVILPVIRVLMMPGEADCYSVCWYDVLMMFMFVHCLEVLGQRRGCNGIPVGKWWCWWWYIRGRGYSIILYYSLFILFLCILLCWYSSVLLMMIEERWFCDDWEILEGCSVGYRVCTACCILEVGHCYYGILITFIVMQREEDGAWNDRKVSVL